MSTTELVWHRSSFSGTGGDNCVEVARIFETVRVRDSKDPQLGRLVLSPTTWTAFAAYVSATQV